VGKPFVGQRREGFVVNLAEAFDLINLNPLGPVDGTENVLADKNVTSLAIEVPIACLTNSRDPIIGASLPGADCPTAGTGSDASTSRLAVRSSPSEATGTPRSENRLL